MAAIVGFVTVRSTRLARRNRVATAALTTAGVKAGNMRTIELGAGMATAGANRGDRRRVSEHDPNERWKIERACRFDTASKMARSWLACHR